MSGAAALAFLSPTIARARQPLGPSGGLELGVGKRELLLTAAERRAQRLDSWPDGTIGFVPAQSGLDTYAANSGVIAKVRHDVATGRFSAVYDRRSIKNLRAKFDYAAGGPVLHDADGSILLMYHAERRRNGNSRSYYSTLGIARSVDDGSNFTDLGEVITPNVTFADFKKYVEIGGGGLVKLRSSTYTYFRDAFPDGRVSALTAAAVASGSETTRPWKKYYQGSFSEPGIGGRSSALGDASIQAIWLSVAFCEYANLIVMAYIQSRNARWELHICSSTDGINWSSPVPIETGVKEALYPSLLGLGDDPSMLGQEFYVYYVVSEFGSWSRWQDAALVRRKIVLH